MSDLPNSALLEQIRSKCEEDRNRGCWIYTLSANNSGYANTRRFGLFLGGESEMIQGSRLAYSALKGAIAEPHPLTSWMFPAPEVTVLAFSSTSLASK